MSCGKAGTGIIKEKIGNRPQTARTNKAGTCFLNQPNKNQILSPHLLPQGSLSVKA